MEIYLISFSEALKDGKHKKICLYKPYFTLLFIIRISPDSTYYKNFENFTKANSIKSQIKTQKRQKRICFSISSLLIRFDKFERTWCKS